MPSSQPAAMDLMPKDTNHNNRLFNGLIQWSHRHRPAMPRNAYGPKTHQRSSGGLMAENCHSSARS